ncbi:MAG: hypothetical protein N3B21_05740 [Clostridia bacterium]|nr:hypothetical protein [Clostridia bacterium]
MKRAIGYVLAVVIGILPAFFLVFNSVFTDSTSITERLFTFALVMAVYGILGVIFGLAGVNTSWRWGIYLSSSAILILVLYSFKEPGIIPLSLLYAIMAIVSSCTAAYLGSRIALRRSA